LRGTSATVLPATMVADVLLTIRASV
jgi:hypothetical protein